MSPPLADAEARERIATDLATSLFVEAAAGTGKTSVLVARVVSVLRRGLGRLPYPLVRRKGDAGFRRLGWDEALDLLADRLRITDPERLAFYLAQGLKEGNHGRDHDEFLEILRVPFGEAMDWLRKGRICETKTVIGLFWLEKMLNQGW